MFSCAAWAVFCGAGRGADEDEEELDDEELDDEELEEEELLDGDDMSLAACMPCMDMLKRLSRMNADQCFLCAMIFIPGNTITSTLQKNRNFAFQKISL